MIVTGPQRAAAILIWKTWLVLSAVSIAIGAASICYPWSLLTWEGAAAVVAVLAAVSAGLVVTLPRPVAFRMLPFLAVPAVPCAVLGPPVHRRYGRQCLTRSVTGVRIPARAAARVRQRECGLAGTARQQDSVNADSQNGPKSRGSECRPRRNTRSALEKRPCSRSTCTSRTKPLCVKEFGRSFSGRVRCASGAVASAAVVALWPSSRPSVAVVLPRLQVVRPRFAAGAPPGPAASPTAEWQRSRNGQLRRGHVQGRGLGCRPRS